MTESTPPEPARFSYGRIALIGAGFGGIMLVSSIYNAQMQFLLGDYFTSRTAIGALMGVDALIALVMIPIIGAWSDRVEGRLGKRLPFVVVGLPVAALAFALLPRAGAIALWTLIAVDVVYMLSFTAYRGPAIALMPDHTPPSKRSAANGVINLIGGIGAVVGLLAIGPLFDIDRNLPFLLGGVALLASLGVVLLAAHRHPPHVASAAVGGAVDGSPARALMDLLRSTRALGLAENRGQLLVLAAIFSYFIGFSALDALFPLYGVQTLGMSEGEATQAVGFVAVAFVLSAVPAGLIGNRVGKAPSMLVGLLLMPAVFVVAPFIDDPGVFPILFVGAGLAWALINVQAYPLVADLGGLTRIGFFTGMYYLFQNGSQAIGPVMLGAAMDVLGDPWLFWGGAVAFVGAFFLLRAGARRLAADPEDLAASLDPLAGADQVADR